MTSSLTYRIGVECSMATLDVKSKGSGYDFRPGHLGFRKSIRNFPALSDRGLVKKDTRKLCIGVLLRER